MAEYWVLLDWNVNVEASHASGGEFVSANGVSIYHNLIRWAETPSLPVLWTYTHWSWAGASTSPSSFIYLNWHSDVWDYYERGTRPDPTPANGALVKSPQIVDSSGATYQITYPNYSWALIGTPTLLPPAPTPPSPLPPDEPSLFSPNRDFVDFNSLTETQKSAIDDGTDVYDAQGDDDTVWLPNTVTAAIQAKFSVGERFSGGGGNDIITGGLLDDNIDGGPGDDILYGVDSLLPGASQAGDNELTGGSGSDAVIWSGSYEEYTKDLTISFKDFFTGDPLKLEIESGAGTDTLNDKIEELIFADQTITFDQIKAAAGFKWALESCLKLIDLAIKYNPGGPVPQEYKDAIEHFNVITDIAIKAVNSGQSLSVWKAVFVESNVLLVEALQRYTDAQVPGSAIYTAPLYDEFKHVVRSGASVTYERILDHTLPISEALGEIWGDFKHGSIKQVDQEDLKGLKSEPFIPDVPKVNFEPGSRGNDTIRVMPDLSSLTPLFGPYHTITDAGAGRDRVIGSAKNDYILAGAGRDRVSGGNGNDYLSGGPGSDILSGGRGRDNFAFDAKASGKSNVDRILDFNYKQDSLYFDNDVFAKLGKKGSDEAPHKLSSKFFVVADRAKDRNDYLVYNDDTGVLYYDANGSAPGKAIKLAILDPDLALSAKDCFII